MNKDRFIVEQIIKHNGLTSKQVAEKCEEKFNITKIFCYERLYALKKYNYIYADGTRVYKGKVYPFWKVTDVGKKNIDNLKDNIVKMD